MDIRDRFEASKFKGRNDHCYKIKRKSAGRRIKNGNSLVDRGIVEWNGLPQKVFDSSPSIKLFRTRVLEIS